MRTGRVLRGQAALAIGAGRVLAVDREPERLALAAARRRARRRRPAHPVTALADANGRPRADVVIEAVGTPDAFETPWTSCGGAVG